MKPVLNFVQFVRKLIRIMSVRNVRLVIIWVELKYVRLVLIIVQLVMMVLHVRNVYFLICFSISRKMNVKHVQGIVPHV